MVVTMGIWMRKRYFSQLRIDLSGGQDTLAKLFVGKKEEAAETHLSVPDLLKGGPQPRLINAIFLHRGLHCLFFKTSNASMDMNQPVEVVAAICSGLSKFIRQIAGSPQGLARSFIQPLDKWWKP